uniref:Sorting nexin-24 n=1 Tax=Cacopsylla melanoneura TaxID=428564 RepID=A0A8D8UB67_9HEMI
MSGSKENCVSISGYKLINCDKAYYVYVIHVRMFQQHYIVEKRYSELHRWHSEIKTKFATPSFPPKKIRHNQHKVLENRRHLLELYLKEMFKFGPSRNQVLAFLGVNSKNSQPQPSTSKNNENRAPMNTAVPPRIEHAPVFVVNPNMDKISRESGEHDLIVNGAMKAFYG